MKLDLADGLLVLPVLRRPGSLKAPAGRARSAVTRSVCNRAEVQVRDHHIPFAAERGCDSGASLQMISCSIKVALVSRYQPEDCVTGEFDRLLSGSRGQFEAPFGIPSGRHRFAEVPTDSRHAAAGLRDSPHAVVQDLAASWVAYLEALSLLERRTPNGLLMQVAGSTDEGIRAISLW